ncbi:MAG: LysR family transcriptional regulator [Pseudomonadota bacterium]
MRNLDISVLRSFVAVAETGGVTRAAGFLNLTQSAVSMQLKRLEELVGAELLDRTNRRIALTQAGEQVLSYARRMVELNDEVFARLTDQGYSGEVRLGVPHDIVYPVIPRVLQRFNTEYPRMRVRLISSYTANLKDLYAHGEFDLILTTEAEVGEGGEAVATLPMRWFGAPNGSAWKRRPLPLANCKRCGFRPMTMAALDGANLPWEQVVESDSDRTIEATVAADIGVTVMLEGTEPAHLAQVPAHAGLPVLGIQRINLYGGGTSRSSEVVRHLHSMLRQGFATMDSVAA